MNKDRLFIFGTILFYITLYLVPSLKFFPIPFGIFFIFAFKYFNNLQQAIFLTAIISIPYSWGKSLFVLGEDYLFVITPFIVLVSVLSLLTLKNKLARKYVVGDIFLTLFILWGIISFFAMHTYPTVLDGVFKLTISILFYFSAKVYMKDGVIKKIITFVLMSALLFESILTITQFLIGHPLGRFIEEGLGLFPYGRLASEDITLFRPSGTMSEPTWMARFLTMLLPIVLINVPTVISLPPKLKVAISLLTIFAIFATFTRVSWVVSIFLLLIIYFWKRPKINFRDFLKPIYFLFLPVLIILTIYLYPYFMQRWQVTPISFEEGKSFDLRVKLIQEAVNLVQQYSLFGVGLNRFVPLMQENDITGFLKEYNAPVHNVPLLIASEMGIPALIFFLAFVVFCYKNYFLKRRKLNNLNERNFIDAAALGGFAYLVESQMGTIFISPHLSVFLLYMAIISD